MCPPGYVCFPGEAVPEQCYRGYYCPQVRHSDQVPTTVVASTNTSENVTRAGVCLDACPRRLPPVHCCVRSRQMQTVKKKRGHFPFVLSSPKIIRPKNCQRRPKQLAVLPALSPFAALQRLFRALSKTTSATLFVRWWLCLVYLVGTHSRVRTQSLARVARTTRILSRTIRTTASLVQRDTFATLR